MKLRETIEDVAAIPRKLNLIILFTYASLLIATAALVIAATKGK